MMTCPRKRRKRRMIKLQAVDIFENEWEWKAISCIIKNTIRRQVEFHAIQCRYAFIL